MLHIACMAGSYKIVEILLSKQAYTEVLLTCVHTYIHTYVHTYIHTYVHTYILHATYSSYSFITTLHQLIDFDFLLKNEK